jgi:hypothetical protein
VDDAARVRVPELLATRHAEALYQLLGRNGVAVVALRTSSLSKEQLSQLMLYRLAQDMLADLIDPDAVYRDGLQQHLPSSGSTGDIHLIAGVPRTGQILCYMMLRALASDATLRSRERPLFPVEQAFGWGIYNDLPVLPDLPIASIVEPSRYRKNQQVAACDESLTRSPVEIGVALHRVVCDGNQRIAAFVGDVKHNVGEHAFGLFHMPTFLLHHASRLPPRCPAGDVYPRPA